MRGCHCHVNRVSTRISRAFSVMRARVCACAVRSQSHTRMKVERHRQSQQWGSGKLGQKGFSGWTWPRATPRLDGRIRKSLRSQTYDWRDVGDDDDGDDIKLKIKLRHYLNFRHRRRHDWLLLSVRRLRFSTTFSSRRVNLNRTRDSDSVAPLNIWLN